MNLASLELNYWELVSGETQHAQNPDTFLVPERDRRENLKRGDAAKLLFAIESEDEDTGAIIVGRERMWVIVAERVGDIYVGVLDNEPAAIEPDTGYLAPGAEVPFKAEHVIDIDKPPDEYVERQLTQPRKRRWPRDPMYAHTITDRKSVV